MSCKGICIRHKALSRYTVGHKRCRSCDLFLKWEGLRCPCCGFKLRTAPRNFRLNARLREQRAIEEARKSEYYRVIHIKLSRRGRARS